jgi:hypothetical protein
MDRRDCRQTHHRHQYQNPAEPLFPHLYLLEFLSSPLQMVQNTAEYAEPREICLDFWFETQQEKGCTMTLSSFVFQKKNPEREVSDFSF